MNLNPNVSNIDKSGLIDHRKSYRKSQVWLCSAQLINVSITLEILSNSDINYFLKQLHVLTIVDNISFSIIVGKFFYPAELQENKYYKYYKNC